MEVVVLERLGHFVYRRRRAVLWGTLVVVIVSGVFGGKVSESLKPGGFDSPDVESQQASELLSEEFRQAPPNFLVLVTAKQGDVNGPAVKAEGTRIANELTKESGVAQVVTHWAFGPQSPLRSEDGTQAIILAEIEGSELERTETAEKLALKYKNIDNNLVTADVGGFEAIFSEVSDKIESDLASAETAAFPITLVLLIVVFASIVAASLPLAIGIISVLGTFLVLRVIAESTDVSTFALPMVTAMGLGLAIDYSLFIVSRFREEMRKGADVETAVVTTVRTAGRTIIFSGITVAVSLAALLVFPLYFFKSFGYAGIGVVMTAVIGAVIFLPSMLAVLGPRVDWAPSTGAPKNGFWRVMRAVFFFVRWPLIKLHDWQLRHHKEVGEGIWHRLAVFVMKRPAPIAIGVVALLLLLGVPFLHQRVGLPDERVLPPGAETRQVHDAIRANFSSEEVNSIRVVAPDVANPVTRRADIGTYAAGLSQVAGVARVDSFAGTYADGAQVQPPSPLSARFVAPQATWLQVIPEVDPFSEDAETTVERIRGSEAPFERILVGGSSAQLVDAKASLFGALPWALAIIGVATFVLLFLMFGSLLVPVKALVLNLLSLTATFGAMVWIFQDGNLSGLLNFTATGSLDISSPILMFCIAFGLSMDYEVFLLSRIKEEYDATGDNERSVALGLERTGRIVTAAAVLIAVQFVAIGTSQVRFIKLFGLGMAVAVLMDAFVIRGTLVPAFMRLAGRANWWLPSWLRPLHARLEIREAIAIAPATADGSRPTHPPTAPRPTRPKPKPIESRTPTRKATPRKKPAVRQTPSARKKPVAKTGTAKRRPAANNRTSAARKARSKR